MKKQIISILSIGCLTVGSLSQAMQEPVFTLHELVERGDPTLVKGFLEQPDIDINKAGEVGLTPLDKAIINRNAEIVELLLGKGANPRIMDDFDNTPLHYAMEQHGLSPSDETEQIIDLLENKLGKEAFEDLLDAPNMFDHTPIDLYEAARMKKIRQFLRGKYSPDSPVYKLPLDIIQRIGKWTIRD